VLENHSTTSGATRSTSPVEWTAPPAPDPYRLHCSLYTVSGKKGAILLQANIWWHILLTLSLTAVTLCYEFDQHRVTVDVFRTKWRRNHVPKVSY